MAGSGGLIQWQAKIGMILIALGSIGLFSITKGWLTTGGEAMSYVLITTSLFGVMLLLLSIGVEVGSEELSQTYTLVGGEEESDSGKDYDRVEEE